jgi:glycine reductase
MDMENQARIKELAETEGTENLVVILGASEPESAELAAETVTAGDPTYAGPLSGVQLGLPVYHIMEPEIKEQIDETVWEEQMAMMEMVLEAEALTEAVKKMRDAYSKL